MKVGMIEDNSGGGVWVRDCGSFIMEGGTISDNKVSTIRGGVFVGKNGIFTMKDGLIEKNIKGGSGGGVYRRYGKFDMSGGTISKNSTNTWGSGVSVSTTNGIDTSLFELSGSAIISDNTAQFGDGVYVRLLGTLNINASARILSNKAEAGGGIYLQDGTFRQSGGEIYRNTAEKEDSVYVANDFPESEYPSIFILTDAPCIYGVIYLEKGETIRPEGTSFVKEWFAMRIEPQFYELPNDEPVQVLDESACRFSVYFHVSYKTRAEWFVNYEGVLERGSRSP